MRGLPDRQGHVTRVTETLDGRYLAIVQTFSPRGLISAKCNTPPPLQALVKARMVDGEWKLYK